MLETKDISEQETALHLPAVTDQNTTIRVATPGVSGYMQPQYDMALAAILATMLGITPEQLVKDCEAHHAS